MTVYPIFCVCCHVMVAECCLDDGVPMTVTAIMQAQTLAAFSLVKKMGGDMEPVCKTCIDGALKKPHE